MECRKEYKISFPKENEHKTFKILDKSNNFKGSIYVSENSVYVSLIDLEISPSNEKRRLKEIEY